MSYGAESGCVSSNQQAIGLCTHAVEPVLTYDQKHNQLELASASHCAESLA